MSNLFKPINPNTPTMSMVMIDKLSIVIPMKDHEYHGLIFSELIHSMEDETIAIANQHSYSSVYRLSAKLSAPDMEGQFSQENPALLIQSTKTNFHRPHIRLEYNPHKLFVPAYSCKEDGQTDYMSSYLNDFFLSICGMDFHQFIQHGKATRMDVCIDISGYTPEDFLVDSSHSLICQNIIDKNGGLGSIYLGSAKSTQYVMYDKAASLYGLDTDVKLTRVEVRSKPNLMVPNLSSAKNPFKPMRIYDLHSVNVLPPDKFDEGYISAFKDSCRFRGIKNAIKQQPKKNQKIIKKHLSEKMAAWWGFKDNWQQELDRALSWSMLSHKPDYVPSLTMKENCGV